jgi:hypothetical protein
MYRVDPASGLAHPTGLLLLSLTDRRIAALTCSSARAQTAPGEAAPLDESRE